MALQQQVADAWAAIRTAASAEQPAAPAALASAARENGTGEHAFASGMVAPLVCVCVTTVRGHTWVESKRHGEHLVCKVVRRFLLKVKCASLLLG